MFGRFLRFSSFGVWKASNDNRNMWKLQISPIIRKKERAHVRWSFDYGFSGLCWKSCTIEKEIHFFFCIEFFGKLENWTINLLMKSFTCLNVHTREGYSWKSFTDCSESVGCINCKLHVSRLTRVSKQVFWSKFTWKLKVVNSRNAWITSL